MIIAHSNKLSIMNNSFDFQTSDSSLFSYIEYHMLLLREDRETVL